MSPKTGSFEDKFLSKLGKIDPRQIRDYLAELLSRKHFFEAIFDHLTEGIVVTDERLRVIYANRVARRMIEGSQRKPILGEDLAERCPPGEMRDLFVAMRRHPRPIENYECPFGSAGERVLALTAIPIRAEDEKEEASSGGETRWVFILSDVTEHRRRMEEQARFQRLASLSLLTSGVAHEIKNPLNSLHIHAQLLLQEIQEAENETQIADHARVEKAAKVILEETGRLTHIINEFIQAARPQSPIIERKYLNRVIEDLAGLFAPECEQAEIELKTDLEPELPPMDMDASLIFQALRNLVRNALDAHLEAAAKEKTEAEATSLRRLILLRTRLSGDQATIEVADNGPGISPENLAKIFEPYWTTKSGGTGLGLMVADRIVTEHHGTIHVDSRPGMGTRFLISLPLIEKPRRLLGGPDKSTAEGIAES